ncbi:MAG: Fic family protein [Actinobacteria bacterium]|nr:Fic family protein [Actinomycetota bacterium]MDI6832111.1 Fic family protein [Actinomycetota bacterium]
MRSFEEGFISGQAITQGLIMTIRTIGEYKGRHALYKSQAPQLLETLRTTAIVNSAEASNRIEGITAPLKRIEELVIRRDEPRNRSEQEIAGYRDALSTIHANWPDMDFSAGLVLQLHRDLFKYVPGQGGRWKQVDDEIAETLPTGEKIVRFKPVPAHLTGEAMVRLHERFNSAWEAGEVEPLLIIPAYILDFLCIRPFLDGNGRMARLITLLLLYKAGYEVGRYISLEKVIDENREGYYDALRGSDRGWHEGNHSLLPWWEFFLGVMLIGAYRELERRVGVVSTKRGHKREMIQDTIRRLPAEFRVSDIERICPGISRPTINRVLAMLRDRGEIRCVKAGRDAIWRKL